MYRSIASLEVSQSRPSLYASSFPCLANKSIYFAEKGVVLDISANDKNFSCLVVAGVKVVIKLRIIWLL
ncbi:MAG: hypothetical protein AAB678_03165 [Patescibacteria group bacterium]